MRTLARTTLASLLLFACGDNGDMQITQTNPTSLDTGGSTADAVTNPSDPGTTGTPTSTSTTAEATTDAPTSEPLTTGPMPTTSGPTTTDASTGEPATDTTDASTTGESTSLMETYGHACETDADCKAILGAGGVCQQDILGVYALPGGYCTTYCQLPDQQTTYQLESEFCTMKATCVGLMGYFEGCAYVCTDSSQCPRDGYECRQMPQISNPDDPKFCLMTEDNMIPP